MLWFIVGSILLITFAFVVMFGAPYLPTLNRQTETALEMLDLKPGQVLLELGSGDGRVLRAAAKRGIHGIGYEINPLLVMFSRLYNWRYRRLINFRWANYWHVKLPECDGIYVFLLDKYMKKLNKKIIQDLSRVKLLSYAFKIPGRPVVKEKNGLFLYKY